MPNSPYQPQGGDQPNNPQGAQQGAQPQWSSTESTQEFYTNPDAEPHAAPKAEPQQFAAPQATPESQQAQHSGGRKVSMLAISALVLAGAVVGGVAGGAGVYLASSSNDSSTSSVRTSGEQRNALDEPGAEAAAIPEGSVAEVAEKVLPSVVSIQVTTPTAGYSGSGSILSSDGLVLTNNHVVAAAADPNAQMQVLLSDGTRHAATLVAGDAATDIAVIRIEGVSDLTPISLGTSENLQVGQEVVAIGSPLGLSSTVTTGIVSAKNRPVVAGRGEATAFIDAIQTDAAINPGNSGGALVDMEGHLIGVPSVIASNSSESEAGSIGLGFAIPIEQARRIADELIETGTVTMPAILANVSVQSTEPGAMIGQVQAGGPADQAGLREGDLITAVDGRTIDSGVGLIAAIRSHKVGDTVTLTVSDRYGADARNVDVTLEAAN